MQMRHDAFVKFFIALDLTVEALLEPVYQRLPISELLGALFEQ